MKAIFPFRWTAILGILLFILVLLEINFYFVFPTTPSGTPPVNVIFLRILISMVSSVGLLGFFSGFKQIVSDFYPDFSLLGNFIFSLGSALAIVLFMANSIQAGTVWIAGEKPVDPTVIGFGGEGALLVYGPINRLLMGIILWIGGIVIFKSGMAPKWIAWLAIAVGIYNLAFIPTLFNMTIPNDFYSTNGWNIPIAANLFFIWVLILSLHLLRKKMARP